MKKFKNINTGVILGEKEYTEMLEREYREMWENNDDVLVQEMKEEGKTIKDFLDYMERYNIDTDFELVELE